MVTTITARKLRDILQVPLDDLPFVERFEVRAQPETAVGQVRPDALLDLHTPEGRFDYRIEAKRTHLTHAIADAVIAHARIDDKQWMLVAPYVPPGIAERLQEAGVDYIDEAGNWRITLGERYFAVKDGQKPERKPAAFRGMRLAGYQVLFAILARPEVADLTVRELAENAGVGKTAAADALNRLAATGLIGRDRPRRLLEPRQLLDHWLAGYDTHVRPRLFVGTYRTPHADPLDLEAAIEDWAAGADEPEHRRWAYGGGAAAYRLTGYYRGEDTVLHVAGDPHELLRALKALKARGGPLRVLGAPGTVAFQGAVPRTVHPLLVYTELHAEGHERARDAARQVAETYLEHLL